MDTAKMIADLERIADRMMHSTTTLSDPDCLLRMAHELRTPQERVADEASVEGYLSQIGAKGGASKSAAKGEASKANGAKGGRPYAYILRRKITGVAISRHATIEAARRASKKIGDDPRAPLEIIDYSENYWNEML